MSDPQRFLLGRDGVDQVVTIHDGLRREILWSVAGSEVARKKSADEKVTLTAAGHGAVRLTFSSLGRPRRVLWYADADDPQILLGTGGTDLHPEPGSKAAKRADSAVEHPTRHTVIAVGGAIGGIAAVAAIGWLIAIILQAIPWPDLPSIPLPDLPDLPAIPWPDLPAIPWPDWNLPPPPAWLAWLLGHIKYIWPVILAWVIARGEIKRRRQHAADAGRGASADARTDADTDAEDAQR